MEGVADLVRSFLTAEDSFDAVAETGRFLYVYNSTTLIASVGGIVAAILVASFLWIAISTALTGHKGSYGGGYGGGGYRKRRAAEEAYGNHSFVELLALLDETFRKYEINSFDCQKRAVCEAHLRHAEAKLGPVARRIHFIFNKIDRNSMTTLHPESAKFFAEYLEAANRGTKNLNCANFYSECKKSLRDHLLKTTNSIN